MIVKGNVERIKCTVAEQENNAQIIRENTPNIVLCHAITHLYRLLEFYCHTHTHENYQDYEQGDR